MKITSETKFLLGTLIATVTIIAGGLFLVARPAPTLTREELFPMDVMKKGNIDAKTYLVEFSDFQCPSCKNFSTTVLKLMETYKNDIVFGYRHFPLTQHPFAQNAAQAAEAAGKQGKFWEMHEYLFLHQDTLSDDLIEKAIDELELNKEQFNADFNSDDIKNKIARDIADGNKFKVSATPTFFLNGKKMTLTSDSSLEDAIKKALNQ